MSFRNNTNNSTNAPLVRNNRFECLNEDFEKVRDRERRSVRMRSPSSHCSNNYSRNRGGERSNYQYNNNSMLRGRFSFLAEKKELKKEHQKDLKKEKFPSLVDIRALKKKSNDKPKLEESETNYKEAASYTQEELIQMQKEKEKEKNKINMRGWVTLSNDNGKTLVHKLDKNGKKCALVKNDDEKEPNYDHAQFQTECAIAMYKTLQNIQYERNENIAVYGCESPYYGKSDLTDLSYLSDSDIESSDSNDEGDEEPDCNSDAETY